MQLKLFILPVKSLDAAEAEMNAFLRSHRVLAVKKEARGGRGELVLEAQTREAPPAQPAEPHTQSTMTGEL